MTLKRAKASRRLCHQNKDWSGTGRSRLTGGALRRERLWRTSGAIERGDEVVVSLSGRLEKMRDAAKMVRARKRSTRLNRRKLRFDDGGARGTMQPRHYGKHGRLLQRTTQFVPPGTAAACAASSSPTDASSPDSPAIGGRGVLSHSLCPTAAAP